MEHCGPRKEPAISLPRVTQVESGHKKACPLMGPPPWALPNLPGPGLVSFIKRRARGHSGRLLCESSPPNARLFIATCSSLRNSHRLTRQSPLLSLHPAAAGLSRTQGHTRHLKAHNALQTFHWEFTKKTADRLRGGKAEASWKGRQGFSAD